LSAQQQNRECKVRDLDGGDERLERRYMEPRWPYPLAETVQSRMGSGSSAKWFLALRDR
jgi:hypothetical protein